MHHHPVQREVAAKDKIIVPLDVPGSAEAMALVKKLGGTVGLLKIGNQLFTASGPDLVKRVLDTGSGVFLDLKFHDIPNTVRGAVESACALDITMLTIHLSGGPEMIEAAIAGRGASKTEILGVTVLTSATDSTLAATGIHHNTQKQVLLLAELAKSAGLRGLVASPQELSMLRREFGGYFITVIPGIRPAWAAAGDQKRIMSPGEASAAGADYLVIGRPITGAPDPAEAVQRVVEEIETETASRRLAQN